MQDDAALSRLLQECKPAAPLPPGFQDAVWRRIDRAEAAGEAGWLLLWRRLGRALTQPALATGYLAVLLLTGVAAGYWQARSVNAQADEHLSARYIQTIDPYQNSHR